MNTKKRYVWLDVARGIAMLLVLMGHCKYIPTYLLYNINSFHMPLFFVISGLVYRVDKYDSFFAYVYHLILRIVIPYFLLCFIMVIIENLLLLPNIPWDTIRQNINGIFLAYRRHGIYYSMWYLHFLFFAQLIAYPIVKSLKNKSVFFGLGILLIIFGYYFNQKVIGYYWSLDLVPIGLGYILLGFAGQRFLFDSDYPKSVLIPTIVALGFITAFFAYLNHLVCGNVAFYRCQYGNLFYFIIPSLTGSLFILLIAQVIQHNAIFEFIGVNSLTFYAFNNRLALKNAQTLTSYIAAKVPVLNNDLFLFFLAVLISCILLAFASIMLNRFLPIAVGKRKRTT